MNDSQMPESLAMLLSTPESLAMLLRGYAFSHSHISYQQYIYIQVCVYVCLWPKASYKYMVNPRNIRIASFIKWSETQTSYFHPFNLQRLNLIMKCPNRPEISMNLIFH